MSEQSKFKKGDKVKWNGAEGGDIYPVGHTGIVADVKTNVSCTTLHVMNDNGGDCGWHYSWRWDKVEDEQEDNTLEDEPVLPQEVQDHPGFNVGDKVKCVHSAPFLTEGFIYLVADTAIVGGAPFIEVMAEDNALRKYYATRFELVSKGDDKGQNTDSPSLGGSTPKQYRITLTLPNAETRNTFHNVHLECMDVIDALDLSGNMKDVLKAVWRMGKKETATEEYDLNKIIFYALREKLKRGIISHQQFWEYVEKMK